ncbi:uncharacterized protein PHALS_14300 [Plasmopara halstedii]|uniref:RxLR-like protein n=1 Tax=Plasmopara halstedii TaxID=4781 RepID=A0A0P1ASP1_PLAHL|nr:uncharacterized protein PHALS_14300 [Plasmopara halstedii]CEG44030.1 hypothetical protein PHALS_14300 [Plasmopara halstedii]|eukprot:XP_024580399.1 hypothetical protein PHALS_14300 [Plasmopara halstedii]
MKPVSMLVLFSIAVAYVSAGSTYSVSFKTFDESDDDEPGSSNTWQVDTKSLPENDPKYVVVSYAPAPTEELPKVIVSCKESDDCYGVNHGVDITSTPKLDPDFKLSPDFAKPKDPPVYKSSGQTWDEYQSHGGLRNNVIY